MRAGLTRILRRSLGHLAVGLGFLCLSVSAQAPLDIRIALVIGNAAYPGAPLANPVNDAKGMADTLRSLGFTVVQVIDGRHDQMADAIARVSETLKGKRAVGMLYYAGHGLQLDWRNYMVPVDAKLRKPDDIITQTVDVGSVIEAFKGAGNRMNILVLDACRDNPFGVRVTGRGLAQLDAPPGTLLAFATAPGNVAEDGEADGNGLYTQYLLQELRKPTEKIEDVFKRVRLQVRQKSEGRQIPWESTSLEDDFYFNDGVKFTFKPEELKRLADQARQKEQMRLQQEQQARERERLAAEALASARARQAEQSRLAEQQRLDAEARAREAGRLAAEASAREQTRLQAEAQAREQQRLEELARAREREQALLAAQARELEAQKAAAEAKAQEQLAQSQARERQIAEQLAAERARQAEAARLAEERRQQALAKAEEARRQAAEAQALARQKQLAEAQAREQQRQAELQAARQREQALLQAQAQAREAQKAAAIILEQERQAEQARLQELDRQLAKARLREQEQAMAPDKQREKAFAEEKAQWDRIKDSKSAADVYAFLNAYPSGSISELAEARLEKVDKARIAPQPDQTGQVQPLIARRFYKGDRYEVVIRDLFSKAETSRSTFEVIAADEDTAEFNMGYRVTQSGAIIRAINGATLDPYQQWIPSGEYQVGKKWTTRSFMKLRTGQQGWVEIRGKVVARETITVPAGTFDTYKMEMEQTGQDGESLKITYWGQPDWGVAVRQIRDIQTRGNNRDVPVREGQIYELVSRKRGG